MAITRNTDLRPVSHDKIVMELRRRGLTCSAAARELGFSETYFGKLRRGVARASTILLLNKVYGIQYDDIKPDEPEPDEPEPNEPANETEGALLEVREFDFDRLGEVIRKAVRDGMLDIITHNNERDIIHCIIKNAVKTGMRENIEDMRKGGTR